MPTPNEIQSLADPTWTDVIVTFFVGMMFQAYVVPVVRDWIKSVATAIRKGETND